jgi:hypothetical protein
MSIKGIPGNYADACQIYIILSRELIYDSMFRVEHVILDGIYNSVGAN